MAEPRPATRRMKAWFDTSGWRDLLIGIPYAWLVFFFLLPFFIVLAISFAVTMVASPPFGFLDGWPYVRFENYERILSDDLFVRSFLVSVANALVTTLICLLIGFPMALCLTRIGRRWRNVLLMLVILPFWTSFLLRVYAWIGLMGTNSWFNVALTATVNAFLPAEMELRSIQLTNTNFAVVLVMVYTYLPFMVLPLYANLERLDSTLDEAALDLGSRPWQVFRDITLPLSVPGIIAGGLLVFIPASGELIIPSLVSNASDPMIGRVISDQFAIARDWPMASAVAVVLLFMLVLPMIAYNHFEAKAQERRESQS